MDDKASVGKISVSSDSVSTLNSEDFVLISRQGDETPSTNNGSDDEKTGLKVRKGEPVTQPELKWCGSVLFGNGKGERISLQNISATYGPLFDGIGFGVKSSCPHPAWLLSDQSCALRMSTNGHPSGDANVEFYFQNLSPKAEHPVSSLGTRRA